MNRSIAVAVAAMALVVVVSNVLVQHLFGDWLTLGAFTYPFAFLVTDLSNRRFGAATARRVVFAGFVVGVLCSLVGSQIHGEFGALVTLRIALASGLAFLTAQLIDVGIFDRLRGGQWWRAPLVSTLIGSSIDTAIFFSLAFSSAFRFIEPGNDVSWANEAVPLLGTGPAAPLWVSLAVADFAVKICLSLIALGPYRVVSARWVARTA